jgi:hypothetical protein
MRVGWIMRQPDGDYVLLGSQTPKREGYKLMPGDWALFGENFGDKSDRWELTSPYPMPIHYTRHQIHHPWPCPPELHPNSPRPADYHD